MHWNAQLMDLERDQLIQGNILALLYTSVITVTLEGEITYVVAEQERIAGNYNYPMF